MGGSLETITSTGAAHNRAESLDGEFVQGHIFETVQVTSGVADVALDQEIPAYSRVKAVHIKCTEIGGITTGTHLALGTASDPDQLAEITFTSIDAVNNEVVQAPDTAMFTGAAAQALQIASTDGSGNAAGTLDDGTWNIAVWYETFPTFDDA